MHALNNEKLLLAWERGNKLREPWRALALLQLALPEWDHAALAALPLAERNALLLRLRAETFGDQLQSFAVCPCCSAQLEIALNARDIERQLESPPEETWQENGRELRMRPATSNDLAVLAQVPLELQPRTLLEQTLTMHAADNEIEESTDELPPAWLERFDRLNASAEVRVRVACAACSQQPLLDIDIACYLWREIALAARRLLAEIHLLARSYGWSEQSILAMSPTRRGAYLEMLSA